MKILFIHNNYASDNSGEEHAAEGLAQLLEEHGHTVSWYRRSSAEIVGSLAKNMKAFCTGIWNPVAIREIKNKIEEFQPDVVQVQNVYPLISAAVFGAVKKRGIPIVMRCPNYRLFCPTGLHLDGEGEVCEQCLSGAREINCIKKNCENSIGRSVGYAVRNFAARKFWGVQQLPDAFIVQTDFQKRKFIQNGIAADKVYIVPGLIPDVPNTTYKPGEKVSFVGRSKKEKGIHEFIEAATLLPDIPFVVAGEVHESLHGIEQTTPENVEWVGFLDEPELNRLYENSRMIVVPGKWYEGFPNVITRAMLLKKPVVTSDLGAMASIIDHEQNGLLVEHGNGKDLAKAIRELYSSKELCKVYGEKGYIKAKENYTSEGIYRNLLTVYRSVNAI
jgi:glycosyltransferase involved in cell wall biosynthesis